MKNAFIIFTFIIAVANTTVYISDSITGKPLALDALKVLGFCPQAIEDPINTPGATGATGNTGATGATGSTTECQPPINLLALPGDLIPAKDDAYTIGSPTMRWKGLQLGPGTLYIEDTVTGLQVGISVQDGTLLLDGTDSLRIGNIRLTSNGIESIISGQDITIGNITDRGYALFSNGIKFPDGTIQTTAMLNGLQGATGPQGLQGIQGLQGEQGLQGLVGPLGLTGTTGATGSQGIQGLPGFNGVNGGIGSIGATGATGATGGLGAQGVQGIQGIPGSLGIQGIQGIQGLQGIPGTPGNIATYYMSAYSDQNQTNETINTAHAMTLNHFLEGNGISIVASSKITFSYAGTYNIQFSAQVNKVDSGTDAVDIWLSQSGVNVPWSNTRVYLVGNNAKQVAAWNFIVTVSAGQYVQLMWSSPDADVRLYAEPENLIGPVRPNIPSLIVTVTRAA